MDPELRKQRRKADFKRLQLISYYWRDAALFSRIDLTKNEEMKKKADLMLASGQSCTMVQCQWQGYK